MSQKQIKDLVEVPEVKTVIQMSDIEDPGLREFLTRSFLITDEVAQILKAFFKNAAAGEGRGYFLEGNFGSGKSHLLSVLSLLFNHQQAWQPLVKQEESLIEFGEEIKNNDYIVLNLSLVEHSSKEYLEDILINEINDFLQQEGLGQHTFKGEKEFLEDIKPVIEEKYPDQLEQFLTEKEISREELFTSGNLFLVEEFLDRVNLSYRFSYDRSEVFELLKNLITEQGYRGLVILIDELSEFLRSKSDGRRFNEDIRFLQFLGEFTVKEPCWIIASLQEQIEKTGDITPEAFNKIKDRFKRFYLTGQHIEELVSKRLIKLKSGAEEGIADICDYYRGCFEDWPVEREEFINLYPVHPLTIQLLDNLKPLFSRHRGIVDFIHYRLKGDSDRNLAGMLDKSADNLLTPEQIFDHFSDRIRERMNTAPYYEKVFKYYSQEINDILGKEEVEVGLKLIKLLILFKISPLEKEYTVRDLANMLLVEVTELESKANYEYIDNILQRLFKHGAYLTRREGEDVYENCYQIDLEADINLIIERKTAFIRENFFPQDRRIFTKLAEKIDHRALPLSSFLEEPRTVQNIYWQQTPRRGYRIFMPFSEISLQNINTVAEKLRTTEADFALLIGQPRQVTEEKKYLKDVLLPELTGEVRKAVAFWLPRGLEEVEFLTEAAARILLRKEYETDNTATGRQIKETLKELIAEDKKRVEEIIIDSYFSGQLLTGQGEVIELDQRGHQSFSDLLRSLASTLLSQRFPYHENISPYRSVLSNDQIEELEEKLLAAGEITETREINRNLKQAVDSYLKPMGLVKKLKKGYRLKVNPNNNQLVRHFLAQMEEERTAVEDLYWELRKGVYGLTKKQFRLLVLVLLYAGYITAYSERQKISLSRLSIHNFGRIKYLGYGEIISSQFQEILQNCTLLPPRFKNNPFSLPLQHQIWEYLVAEKRDWEEKLNNLRARLTDLQADPLLEEFDFGQMQTYLDKVKQLFAEIKVSYASDEGLERFATSYRNLPNIDQYLERVEKIEEFTREEVDDYRRIKSYLQQVPESIPEELIDFYENLCQSLADESMIFDSNFREEVKQSFKKFRKSYSEEYFALHQRQLGEDRFKPYRQIKESRAYNILKQFNGLETISVKDDLIKINRKLREVLNWECKQLDLNRLRQYPLCECEFRPEDKVELLPISKLRRFIERGIIQYLEALKEEENRVKIENYLANMEAVGKKRFARPIRELLKLSSETDKLLDKLDKRLNNQVIKRLNQALGEDVAIVERDLDQLYENLVGRTFSPSQLKKIFTEWLEKADSLDDKTYIKVVGGRNLETEAEEKNLLEDYLHNFFPELASLIDKIGANTLALLILLNKWQESHDLNREIISKFKGKISNFTEGWQFNYRRAYSEVLNHLKEEERREVITEIVKRAEEFKPEQVIYNGLSQREFARLITVLEQEEYSMALIKKVILKLIKMIENKQVDLAGLEQAVEQLKSSNQEVLFETKEDLLELVKAYLKVGCGRLVLNREHKLLTYRKWEEVYSSHLAQLEYELAQIKELSSKLVLDQEIPLEKLTEEIYNLLNEYQREFKSFMESQELDKKPEDQVMDIKELVKKKYPKVNKNLNTDKGFLLLLDGLRWDLKEQINEQLKDKISLREIESGSILAELPTNTETQLERLKAGDFAGPIVGPEDFSGQPEEIIKFSFIDDKVHTVKDDYSQFVKEVLFQVENRLIPLIEELPRASSVLIFGDHGYRINYSFQKQDKFDTPRYLHGGASIFERIVPWTVFYKV